MADFYNGISNQIAYSLCKDKIEDEGKISRLSLIDYIMRKTGRGNKWLDTILNRWDKIGTIKIVRDELDHDDDIIFSATYYNKIRQEDR